MCARSFHFHQIISLVQSQQRNASHRIASVPFFLCSSSSHDAIFQQLPIPTISINSIHTLLSLPLSLVPILSPRTSRWGIYFM
ncbi:unnamed protein product [Rhodiola kirilowii]